MSRIRMQLRLTQSRGCVAFHRLRLPDAASKRILPGQACAQNATHARRHALSVASTGRTGSTPRLSAGRGRWLHTEAGAVRGAAHRADPRSLNARQSISSPLREPPPQPQLRPGAHSQGNVMFADICDFGELCAPPQPSSVPTHKHAQPSSVPPPVQPPAASPIGCSDGGSPEPRWRPPHAFSQQAASCGGTAGVHRCQRARS